MLEETVKDWVCEWTREGMGNGIQVGMAERPRDQNVSGLWDLLVVALAGGRGPKPRVAAVNKVNRFFNTHFMEIMSSDAFPNAYFVVRKKNNPCLSGCDTRLLPVVC